MYTEHNIRCSSRINRFILEQQVALPITYRSSSFRELKKSTREVRAITMKEEKKMYYLECVLSFNVQHSGILYN
jgi:hypothetical protein